MDSVGTKFFSGHTVRHDSAILELKSNVRLKDDLLLILYKSPNKHRFKEICDKLVVGLRGKYSDKVRITLDGIKTLLGSIDASLKNDDHAKLVLSLCTHRHETMSRVSSYPDNLAIMYEALELQKSSKYFGFTNTESLSKIKKQFLNNEIYQDPDFRVLANGDFHDLHFQGSLNGANFTNANFTNANLSKSSLSGVNFNDSNLDKCKFDGTKLGDCQFNGKPLDGSDLKRVDYYGTNFNKATMNHVQMSNLRMGGVDFSNTFLNNVTFNNIDFNWVSFNNAKMNNVKMTAGDLSTVTFEGNTTITFDANWLLELDDKKKKYLLSMINSINDKYEILKNSLRQQVEPIINDNNQDNPNNNNQQNRLSQIASKTQKTGNNIVGEFVKAAKITVCGVKQITELIGKVTLDALKKIKNQ